jgi:Protein of unknown function (DUF1569).
MKTVFDIFDREEVIGRIDAVTAESKPRWGKMNAEMMLAHLVASVRMAKGELEVKPKKLPIRFFPLRQLIVYWLPFPKGAPTAPELLPSDPGAIEENKHQLAQLLKDVGGRGAMDLWPYHPAFGNLGRRGWGVLIWRHVDHHLRQFGA